MLHLNDSFEILLGLDFLILKKVRILNDQRFILLLKGFSIQPFIIKNLRNYKRIQDDLYDPTHYKLEGLNLI